MIINLNKSNGRIGKLNSKLETRKNWSLAIGHWSLRRAFSLTEILITMSLILLLAGAGLGGYFQYYKTSLMNSDVDNAMTLLKYTRFNALKNPTNSDYGVHIDVAQSLLIGFRGAYNPFDASNKTVKLEQLRIEDLNLMPSAGVTNEILFKNQTGKTDNTGSFIIGKDDYTYIFSINSQGVVN